MPSKEQLDNMAELLLPGSTRPMTFKELPRDMRIECIKITISAMQAKALSDIAYLEGFKNIKA